MTEFLIGVSCFGAGAIIGGVATWLYARRVIATVKSAATGAIRKLPG